MKKVVLQKIATTTALLAVMSYVGTASAHTIPNSLAAAGAVDLFQTTCKPNVKGKTAQLVTRVKAAKLTPLVSVQAYKGKLASQTTDAKGGDAAYSPDAKLGGGDGVYTILVDKSGSGKINYILDVHCQTLTGAHTEQPEPVQVQNQ
ncbi:conserved exported hypothetical protein [Crenothrix polyspora]|uniref:Uncharacterized protein n=1 Tax=Crenothrix polyspora TaxID=360316 RepID=A0A1R4H0T5_9GAMM|nr:hypothetical protein [Crenothrix polyspora]SJM89680.1 conserved exported hypothetical protein [Crenothrix polyspora]